MKERKISKSLIIMILILVCGIGYYIAVFIIPELSKSPDIPDAEISQGGEFYYGKVSELDKAFNGDYDIVVKFKGSGTEYLPRLSYDTNVRQISIATSSDKGYQTNRIIENINPKVKGNYYGKLYSFSIVYKVAAFTKPGFPREPEGIECLENFCVKAHS